MEFKHTVCNLCGSNEYRQIAKCKIEKTDSSIPMTDMSMIRCLYCGLVFVNPQPSYTQDELKALYSEEYFDAPYMRFYAEKEGLQSNESFGARLDWIKKHRAWGTILDIGCASGGFLKAAQERGWQVFGVEVSESASGIAREKYGLEVVTCQLEDAGFNDASFDVVSAGDVFEHIFEPKRFLIEIHRVLKKGGLLYLAVPDFDGLYYKIAVMLSRFNHKNYFVLPYHLYFYTRRTLEQYLNECCFKVLGVRSSEAAISDKGIKGMIKKVLFFIARMMHKQDRLLILAQRL